jgi:hypothetical protein
VDVLEVVLTLLGGAALAWARLTIADQERPPLRIWGDGPFRSWQ